MTNDYTDAAGALMSAYLDQDWDRVRDMLDPDIVLRAVLPSRAVEAQGPEDAVAAMAEWLEPHDQVLEVEALEVHPGSSSHRVFLRYGAITGTDPRVFDIEHTILLRFGDAGAVTKWDMVCSGWVPRAA